MPKIRNNTSCLTIATANARELVVLGQVFTEFCRPVSERVCEWIGEAAGAWDRKAVDLACKHLQEQFPHLYNDETIVARRKVLATRIQHMRLEMYGLLSSASRQTRGTGSKRFRRYDSLEKRLDRIELVIEALRGLSGVASVLAKEGL